MAKATMPKGEVKRKSGGNISILRDASSSALKVGSIVGADRGSKKRLASSLSDNHLLGSRIIESPAFVTFWIA